MLSSPWFLSLFRSSGREIPRHNLAQQSTRGSHSQNIVNHGSMTFVNAAAQPMNNPKASLGGSKMWHGVLYVASPSSLSVGRTDHVKALLCNQVQHDTLSPQDAHAELVKVGEVKQERCEIPFRMINGEYRPTPVRIELITADQFIRCPQTTMDFDLKWCEELKPKAFPIQATRPGTYKVDVVLLARKKHISTVSVSGTAEESSPSEAEYEWISRITIEIHVGRELRRDLTLEELTRDERTPEERTREQELGMDRSDGLSL